MKILLIWLSFPFAVHADSIPADIQAYGKNKEIPESIAPQVLQALAHFPELLETDIRFRFKENLRGPVMAARPVTGTMLRHGSKRAYNVLINPMFKLKHLETPMDHIPDSVMIGWIGHELGHIMDYKTKSSWQMAGFGLRYWISDRFVKRAERIADTYATKHGLGDYILAHKDFVLGHADLPEDYKARIAKLYLSPDDIVELIARLENEDPDEQEEILDDAEELETEA